MGADCIGYILVGPKRLLAGKVKKASKHLASIQSKAASMLAKGLSEEESENLNVSKEFNVEMGGMEDYDAEHQLQYLAKLDDKFLDEFVGWWNSDGWRDSACRHWKDKKILTATEMSWGDGPSEGSSAELCERAERSGILSVLGIE